MKNIGKPVKLIPRCLRTKKGQQCQCALGHHGKCHFPDPAKPVNNRMKRRTF